MEMPRGIVRYLRTKTRPARHGLTMWLVIVFVRLIRTVPHTWAICAGRALGVLTGRLAWRVRRLSARSLGLARLPTPPSVDQCWADLGQRLAEFARMEQMLCRVVVDQETLSLLQEGMTGSVGTLVATAHLGHWELMAAALVRHGFPVHAIASHSNTILHRWLAKERARFGVRTLHRNGGARRALAHLNQGTPVVVFVDQVSSGKKRECHFLGHPAFGSVTYQRLLRLSHANGLLVWNTRDSDGIYHIKARRIPDGVDHGSWLDRQLENLIEATPEQWVWLHDRWTAIP